MAKKTIKELEALLRAKWEAIEAKRSNLAIIDETIETKEAAAEAAAAAGDQQTYDSLQEELAALRSQKYVTEKSIEHDVVTNSYTDSEVNEAWESYSTAFDSSVASALATFNTHRAELLTEYMAIVEQQNTAIKMRDICGELVGLNDVGNMYSNDENEVRRLFPLNFIEETHKKGDAAKPYIQYESSELDYFGSTCASTSQAAKIGRVIMDHRQV